jgi:hypothetical protein
VVFFKHIWQRKKNLIFLRAFYIYGHFMVLLFSQNEVDQDATAGYPVFTVNKSVICYHYLMSSSARALGEKKECRNESVFSIHDVSCNYK